MTTGPERTLIFTPPGVDLRMVLEEVAGEGQTLEVERVTSSLLRLFNRVQQANGEWADERFKKLRVGPRVGMHDWSLDGILVNGEGRIVLGPWSTYNMYLTNKVTDLSMTHLLAEMHRKAELLFPLHPQRDSAYFWLEEHEEQVLTAIKETLPDVTEIEHYTDYSSTDFGFRRIADTRRVKATRIRSGKIGDAHFAAKGVVRGRLGFWENTTPEGSTYTPRVFIEKSGIFPQQTYISPTPESRLLTGGAIPMDENHPNLRVLRADPNLVEQNFIVAALIAFSGATGDMPFVLRFDTYRPWAGFYPHHS